MKPQSGWFVNRTRCELGHLLNTAHVIMHVVGFSPAECLKCSKSVSYMQSMRLAQGCFVEMLVIRGMTLCHLPVTQCV
jgi:hypothetical protein